MYVCQLTNLILFILFAPHLSWEEVLVTTKAEKQLLPAIVFFLYKNAIQVGNNEQRFNFTEQSVFGPFFDVTFLYAGSMEQPIKPGKCLEDWHHSEWHSLRRHIWCHWFLGWSRFTSLYTLHSIHNDLPLTFWLSSYALTLGLTKSCTAKLIKKLFDKPHHVCHFRYKSKFFVEYCRSSRTVGWDKISQKTLL